ncbi:Os12g0512750 [Oryza sativa Japonica Group]|uniref:Os12g0512750 protein n=1 Tax=Oryza sativa subsp. japonica TaxID=39947 RepID=A0A0P0YAM3_ORYSJ|nr:Os12g0512750 [Oryza sativa Japonica Group]
MSSSSSHHPEFASCTANDDEHHLDEFELELVVQDVQRQQNNGSANTDQHERENLLLLDDSSKSGALKRRLFFDNLLKNVQDDHIRFLHRQKERIDRHSAELRMEIICRRYGIVPRELSQLTLLLGPPGCGKSTLLRALSGKLDKSLKRVPWCHPSPVPLGAAVRGTRLVYTIELESSSIVAVIAMWAAGIGAGKRIEAGAGASRLVRRRRSNSGRLDLDLLDPEAKARAERRNGCLGGY